MKRRSYKDDFEMVTLRHEYLKNIHNVDPKEIEKWKKYVNITAYQIYNKYRHNFEKVSFDIEDVISIAQVYLVGYLSNYGFKTNPDSVSKFVKKFVTTNKRMPNEAELYKAERNEIINFLRQKISYCSGICGRKARNITVGTDIKKRFAKTPMAIDVNHELILEDHTKYGYRKVTAKEWKEISKNPCQKSKEAPTDKNGFEVITIEKFNTGITYQDYSDIVKSYDTIHSTNPEDFLIKLEDERTFDKTLSLFYDLTQTEKIKSLKVFIKNNTGNKILKKELMLAKKMLLKHSFWYGY
jgi:hypothetical protein